MTIKTTLQNVKISLLPFCGQFDDLTAEQVLKLPHDCLIFEQFLHQNNSCERGLYVRRKSLINS